MPRSDRSARDASCRTLQRTIGLVLLAERQSEAKCAALAMSSRRCPHAAAVRLDDALAEVEPESRSGNAFRRFRPIATTEQLRKLVFAETDTLVAHAHGRAVLVSGHRHRDRRA